MFWMGVWLAGTLIMAIVATQNFFTIDRLLADSGNDAFRSAVNRLGAPQSRDLLRYLSSELNRLYFQLWNIAQLIVGLLALWSVTRTPCSRRSRWGIGLMLGLVVLMSVVLLPQILSVGRSLDFVPRNPAPPSVRRFGILHAAYTTLDLLKFIIGVVVTIWIRREAPRGDARRVAT